MIAPSLPGLRERKRKDKIGRITLAARKLFHEKGFRESTVAEIARLAGVSEGTVFFYVPQKEDLLILAFAEELAEVVDDARNKRSLDADFITQMAEFFGSLMHYHLQDISLAKEFLREVGFFRDPHKDYGFDRVAMHDSIHEIVKAAADRGEIGRKYALTDISHLCFASYWYCLTNWANDMIDHDQFKSRLRLMLEMQLQGLKYG